MNSRHHVGDKMELKKALEEFKKEKERKFEQSVDLIVNLKGVDVKKENIAVVIGIPNKFREKKVCAFLNKNSELVDSVLEADFVRYKDKGKLKGLVKKYDFFIANASLMPKVATTFGKVLGPAGKMPSPQLGILTQESDNAVKEMLERISKSIKIRVKEPSIKIGIGKQNMEEEKIIENFDAVYQAIVNALPVKKENVKSVLIKLTMGKPIKLEVK